LDCMVLEAASSSTLHLGSMMNMRRCSIVVSIDWIIVNLTWMVMNVRRNNMHRVLRVSQWMMVDMWGDLLLLMLIVALLIVI